MDRRTELTPEQVSSIHEFGRQGMPWQQIARTLGISGAMVYYRLSSRYKDSCRDWQHNHPGYVNENRHRDRLEVLSKIGKRCLKCGTDDYRVLQINHIGSQRDKHHGYVLCADILYAERSIDDLTTLCANCNILYEYEIGRRSRVTDTRLKVLTLLGKKCERCGNEDPRVLQINHINGGGGHEIKARGGSMYFYSAILDGSRAIGDLNVLCANCNIVHEYERDKAVVGNPFEELRRLVNDSSKLGESLD